MRNLQLEWIWPTASCTTVVDNFRGFCRKNFIKTHERLEINSIKQQLQKVEIRILPANAHHLLQHLELVRVRIMFIASMPRNVRRALRRSNFCPLLPKGGKGVGVKGTKSHSGFCQLLDESMVLQGLDYSNTSPVGVRSFWAVVVGFKVINGRRISCVFIDDSYFTRRHSDYLINGAEVVKKLQQTRTIPSQNQLNGNLRTIPFLPTKLEQVKPLASLYQVAS